MTRLGRRLAAGGGDYRRVCALFIITAVALGLIPPPAVAAPPPIEVDARPGVSSTHVKYATFAINGVVKYFSDNYRMVLHQRLRIILVPDDTEYANVLMRNFNYNQADALKMARTTGGMAREGKGEYIFVAKAKKNAAMDAFMIGTCHELVHWYQYQAGGENRSARIKWLLEGCANIIAHNIVETHQPGTVAKYHQRSLTLIKRVAAVPSLGELYSRRDWLAASDRYGTSVVYSKAELAVSELAQRQGLQSLFYYFLNLKNLPPDKAFERAFGLHLRSYEAEMDQRLRK